MATVEEQLKQLVADVKTIGVEQVKGNQDLKEPIRWKESTTRSSTDLQLSIDNLTSRIQALEATFFQAPPKVPSREGEGRAICHGKNINHQGVEPGTDPDSTLVKGENPFPKTLHFSNDIQGSSSHQHYMLSTNQHQYGPREYRLPKLDFPKFSGEHPKFGGKSVKSTLACLMFLFMFGFPLPPSTLGVMLNCGFKPMKLSILLVVGLSYVLLLTRNSVEIFIITI
jgi:hypothetical protein